MEERRYDRTLKSKSSSDLDLTPRAVIRSVFNNPGRFNQETPLSASPQIPSASLKLQLLVLQLQPAHGVKATHHCLETTAWVTFDTPPTPFGRKRRKPLFAVIGAVSMHLN